MLFSNSSLDVIMCFNEIITEWRKIDYEDADFLLLGCTKLTDVRQ